MFVTLVNFIGGVLSTDYLCSSVDPLGSRDFRVQFLGLFGRISSLRPGTETTQGYSYHCGRKVAVTSGLSVFCKLAT